MVTGDSFFLACKRAGLSLEELEYFTIGSVLEYMEEYVDSMPNSKKDKTRKATQNDFDSF